MFIIKKNTEKTIDCLSYLISCIFLLMLFSFAGTWLIMPYKGIADERVKVYGYKKINIEKINILLKNSPIRSSESVHFFIVPRWLMGLINPVKGFTAQGFNIPIINFVFANENTVLETTRTLEGVVAHEVTHSDIFNKFGIKTLFYDAWRIEGSCDYVSKESSITTEYVEEVLNRYNNNKKLNNQEKYLIYKMQVEKLVKQGKSFKEIIEGELKQPTL